MIWKKYAQNHLTEIPISGTCHLVCSALYAIAYTNLAFDLKSPWRLNSNCTFNTIVKRSPHTLNDNVEPITLQT